MYEKEIKINQKLEAKLEASIRQQSRGTSQYFLQLQNNNRKREKNWAK